MTRYRWGLILLVVVFLGVGFAVGSGVLGPRTGPPAPVPAKPASSLSALQVTPDEGPTGARVQVAAAGLPPGTEVTFAWDTASGRYRMDVDAGSVAFHGYAYDPAKTGLGKAVADSQGRAAVSFAVPEDIAGPHRIVAAVGERDVAQGLFHYLRTATMTPLRGPVGTPIDIMIQGLGPAPWNAAAVSYDNHFVGFITAITTHGTAHARIRASGAPGPHLIELNSASNAMPFLNSLQGPGLRVLRIVSHRSWTFTVTPGATLPPTQIEWPAADRVARSVPDALSTAGRDSNPAPGISLGLTPTFGLIGSRVEVRARGLGPTDQAQVVWGTMGRVDPVVAQAMKVRDQTKPGTSYSPGPAFADTLPLFAATAAPDGTVSGKFAVPDDRGGWHTIRLVRDGKVLASAPYFVARSLVAVTPTRVKAGQEFKVEVKGFGATDLDNGAAVTYDNIYTGYACGFYAHGYVVIPITATGAPGIHLIDLYPMIYQGGKGEAPWSYQVPQLSALEDGPGLSLGYTVPIIRLAVEVVP